MIAQDGGFVSTKTQTLLPVAPNCNRQVLIERAILTAENSVYRDKASFRLPQYGSHKIEGNEVTVSFVGARAGLDTRHREEVSGFEVCGKDSKWAWANARIVGRDSVVVSAPAVDSPVAVRFGWAYRREWTNLFNSLGLPVCSFSTAAPTVGIQSKGFPTWHEYRLGQWQEREQYWFLPTE